MTLTLKYKLLEAGARPPQRAHDTDAGWDLFAHSPEQSPGRKRTIVIAPNSTKVIRTGIAIDLPKGFCGFVCSRSGMASDRNTPLFVANAPGIVDSGYQGDLSVILFNGGFQPAYIQHEQKIAQLLIRRVLNVEFECVDDFDTSTERGEKGFGSTGSF